MSLDLRVSTSFASHYKTEALVEQAGEKAVRCLLRLWSWAAQNRPKGVLTGCSSDAIRSIAMYTASGEHPVDWTAVLKRVGFLDGCGTQDDPYRLHDWEFHQPYIFHREKRSRAARRAAAVRWGKRYETNCDPDASGNAPPPTPSPPPSPTPRGRGREGKSAGSSSAGRSPADFEGKLEQHARQNELTGRLYRLKFPPSRITDLLKLHTLQVLEHAAAAAEGTEGTNSEKQAVFEEAIE